MKLDALDHPKTLDFAARMAALRATRRRMKPQTHRRIVEVLAVLALVAAGFGAFAAVVWLFP